MRPVRIGVGVGVRPQAAQRTWPFAAAHRTIARMTKIVTTITPPRDWSERETHMLRLVLNLAAGMERNRSKSELLAKMVTALAHSLRQADIPLVPHDEGAPFEAKVHVEFAAAWQAAADLVKEEFPEVQIALEIV